MVKSRAIVQFEEKEYQVFFLDFRVFVQGVEITPWITSSLTITKVNRDGAGTAAFTLDNAMDRFVLTKDNLPTKDNPSGTWRDTTDRYSETAKHQIFLYKMGANRVTVDRIHELAATLWERAFDETENLSQKELRRRLQKRGQRLKGQSRETLATMAAADDAASKLSAEDLDSAEGTASAKEGIFQQLMTRGGNAKRSREIANTAVEQQKRKIAAAGNKHPDKGAVEETNPDQTDSEIAGRHKRQKFIRNPVDPDTGDARWPLAEREVVFHKNDPVIVFLHNPLTEGKPAEAGDPMGFWLYGFTGFLDQYPVQTDYVKGQSTISVQCYDIRAMLQKMRVQLNTVKGPIDPAPLFTQRDSIFRDMLRAGQATAGHPFANFSFEDAMALVLTGATLTGEGSGGVFGVGELKVGKVVTYPTNTKWKEKEVVPTGDTPKMILEEWHTLCINGPSAGSKLANLNPLTNSDVLKIGRETTSDGAQSPFRKLVHFLLPSEGTAAGNLVQKHIEAVSGQRDFVTRFEIITDFCAKLDYEMTVLPNGDIAFEFPMYDFMPEDFGDWQPVFEVDKHLISGGFSDEANDIITALIVNGGVQRAEADARGRVGSMVIRGIIQSSLLASRVGIIVDTVTLPFVEDRERLRSLGLIEFQKRLANANTLDMDFSFRPFLVPNRPLHNKVERRIGITSSITETIQLFSTGGTSASTRFIRSARANGSFRFITGGDSLPISYKTIFPGSQKSVGNTETTGVRDSLGVGGEKSAFDSADPSEIKNANIDGVNNDDRPPNYIQEIRPGTFYTLSPSARRIAGTIAQSLEGDEFLLNHTPVANGSSFSVRARDNDGRRIYSDQDRLKFALSAKENGYTLIDTRYRFVFEPRRPNHPDFIVRPENG